MAGSKTHVTQIFSSVGYQVPESDLDDYVSLLDRAKAAFEKVEAMGGSFGHST
jgi:amidase